MIINGVYYSGSSICVSNGKVIIDGKDCTPDAKIINITVDGDIEKIDADNCNKIEVKRNVTKGIKTMSGDVTIGGKVEGDVSTQSGDIECDGDIGGSVKTMSGDVKCGNISGDVSTLSGDIKKR